MYYLQITVSYGSINLSVTVILCAIFIESIESRNLIALKKKQVNKFFKIAGEQTVDSGLKLMKQLV